MKFILSTEAEAAEGGTSPERYAEIVEEAQFAEEMGFHGWSTSEQHFNKAASMTSAPECILPFVAARTSKLRLRATSFVLLTFNHPLRVAERVNTIDVLSGGRFELGTARSNNPRTIKAFEVDADDTRPMWFESMEILRKALTQDEVSHHGRFWTIDPPVSIVPASVQEPHPPIWVSATSVETHVNAGRLGIGVMTGNSLPGGWAYIEECARTYKEALASADPGPSPINDSMTGNCVIAHCAETKEQAFSEASARATRFLTEVAGWFSTLARQSSDYAAMSELEKTIADGDLEAIVERAPYVTIGTPDLFVERARRLEEIGYDEYILNIDGMPHDQIMRSLELIGRHVIPAVS
jgi:alkanesulfonate monooxygenase SsuD/methylene tetrahydromethanopterin reductase-like flavin-dependent oxidoreductase (luciferase family)